MAATMSDAVVQARPRAHTLRVARTADEAAAVAAAEVLAVLETAIAWRGEAHLCLSGGSTPRRLHRALVDAGFGAWPHVHVWFGDERCVPPTHPDSNARMARETLLDVVDVDPAHIHAMRGDTDPTEAAAAYHTQLQAHAVRPGRTVPVMDALVLGMGDDGHTASVFPGSPLLRAPASPQWCAAVHVPALDAWRLTLTPPVLCAAAATVVLVAGGGKQSALRRVVRGEGTTDDLPIRLLEAATGDVAWFVDDAALFG